MAPPPARRRRVLYWLLLPVLILFILLVAAALALPHFAQRQGLRLTGFDWQHGLVLAEWDWLPQGCSKARGQGLHVEGINPLRLRLRELRIGDCPSTGPLTSPPWTPPFDLQIDRLLLPGLPPLTANVHQHEQRWTVEASHQQSHLHANYDRPTGQWAAQGQVQAAHVLPAFLGELNMEGKGLWQGEQLEGQLQAQGHQLGYAGQPQRADASLAARYEQGRWQAEASLGAPLALGQGWVLEARKALLAQGTTAGIDALQVEATASGPQGRAMLTLDTEGPGIAGGPGLLSLSGPELKGRVPLRWTRDRVELAAASLQLPGAISVSWPAPLSLPIAAQGKTRLSADLGYQGLRLQTRNSELRWQNTDWQWQGRLALAGRYEDYKLAGVWQGSVNAAGPHGDPASLTIKGPGLQLALSAAVAGIRLPKASSEASFSGRYGDFPLKGKLSARYEQGRVAGSLEADSRLPLYDQGGALTLKAPWELKDGQWQLGPGSRLELAEGLVGKLVIKPLQLSSTTALRLKAGGVHGKLQVESQGLVAARSVLPALSGPLELKGQKAQVSLRIPAWQSDIVLTGTLNTQGKQARAEGTIQVDTPLAAAMSRGLPVTLKAGRLRGQARWQWQQQFGLQGEAGVSGLGLDWGGIVASGGEGQLQFELAGKALKLASLGPLQLGEVDLGTPVRKVSLELQSDLDSWHFRKLYAEVLGGKVEAPLLHWPSPDYQPVTVSSIDLAQVAALQGDDKPAVQLAGPVGGTLPIRLLKDSMAVENGRIANEGPLLLKIRGTDGVSAMGQSSQAVSLALDTLSHLAVSELAARLDMKPDGWLTAAITIKGQNPQKQQLPVVLNYTHQENIFELLRSLRIADEISRQVLDRQPAEGLR